MIERSKLKGMKQGSESSSAMRPRPAPRSVGASRAEVRALEIARSYRRDGRAAGQGRRGARAGVG